MTELAECVETLWGFTKFIFKHILKVSAFYLEKQKVLFLKKTFSWRQYQNKKALFIDPIFSEGFAKRRKPKRKKNPTNIGLKSRTTWKQRKVKIIPFLKKNLAWFRPWWSKMKNETGWISFITYAHLSNYLNL